jgi:hypothetical protein
VKGDCCSNTHLKEMVLNCVLFPVLDGICVMMNMDTPTTFVACNCISSEDTCLKCNQRLN